MTDQLIADQYVERIDPDELRASTSPINSFALSHDATPFPLSLLGFVLLLAVGLVHVQDQGGFIGNVTPRYIAVGYYLVEVGAAIAIPLVLRKKTAGWVLGAMVSIGPFIAYILSRSVGLPGDPGDVGNWGYTLGTVSLLVEGALFILCTISLQRAFSRWQRPDSSGERSGL